MEQEIYNYILEPEWLEVRKAVVPAIIAGGVAVGSLVAGMLGRKKQNKENKRRIEEQRAETQKLQEQNQDKQKEMWHYTNFTNQRKEMEKAGLNVGMLYGGGGAGGATTGTAGGAQGSMEDEGNYNYGEDVQAGGQLAMQMSLMQAQKDNIEADTKDKEADTQAKTTTGTEEANLRIDTLKQGLESGKLQQQAVELDNKLKEIELYINENGKDASINKINYEAEKMYEELKIIITQGKVDEATADAKIELMNANVAGIYMQLALSEANVKLTEEQTKAIGETLAQGWANISVAKQNANTGEYQSETSRLELELKEKYPSIMNIGGNIVKDGVMNAEKALNGAKKFFENRKVITREEISKQFKK